MNREREYQWVALRFEYERSGDVLVRWRDQGSRWSPPPGTQGGPPLVLPGPPELPTRLVVRPDLHEHLERLSIPDVLAVFVDAPVQLRGLPLELLGRAAIEPAGVAPNVQFVRWAHRRSGPSGPFRLPLRVVAVGPDYVELQERLRDAVWYASAPEIVDLGFQFELLHPGEVSARLTGDWPVIDVVVTRETDVGTVLGAAGAGHRPRLIACIGDMESGPSWLSTLSVPAGSSLAWLPSQPGRTPWEQAKALLYEVIHDHPLHEALWHATMGWELAHLARLISDPVANQSLRLSDAANSLVLDVAALTSRTDVGDVDQFLERLDQADRVRLVAPLRAAARSAGPVHDAVETTWRLSVDYARESTGLNPLSHMRAAWTHGADAQRSMVRSLEAVSRDPVAVDVIRRNQRRVVDIVMQRLEPSPMLMPGQMAPWLPIEREIVLRAETAYRLRVHIGTPSHGSLLTERPPSVDPLLPDPPDARGHELEIVLYGHDFEPLGERHHKIYLPLLGGVDPVYFDLRAPAISSTEEDQPAQARVAVYYRGNLLQSFLLHALLSHEEHYGPPDALRVELEFSQSSRLANLDDVGPRAFSVAANESAGGAHRLMFKTTGDEADVTLTAEQIDDRIEQFRRTLLDATFTDLASQTQRFELGSPPDWDEFDRYVRLLAKDGAKLFEALYVSSADLQPALRAIGGSQDELIQVVLHNARFGLPWAGIYDRTPPKTDEPVCLGGVSRGELEAGAPLEFRCGHGYDSKVFCVFGFWGIRQRLEYRLAGGGDPVPLIDPEPDQRRVCLATGDPDAFTEKLRDDLRGELGDACVKVLGGAEDPLDVLWSPARPAEIVLLGHLEIPEGEPNNPRIVFFGNPKPLCNDDVFERVKLGPWEVPQSLVLLMACGSAVSDLRSLVSLLETFTAAHAGAVVGTETPVVTSLVSRFAADLTVAMWRGDGGLDLGAAMTDVRRGLLQAANPLAFGFSAYGNADIRIAA